MAEILAERYQIIRPLARGGFGQTFLASDHHLPGQPHCVIKQLILTHELQVIAPEKIPLALIICGALFVRIFGVYRIVPAEILRWSWRQASRSLLLGLAFGAVLGVTYGVFGG